MQTFCKQSFKKEAELSWTTCSTLKRVLKYSTNLFIKATKCSALRILPGTASAINNSQHFMIVDVNFKSSAHILMPVSTTIPKQL